jgi:hypothetical protein
MSSRILLVALALTAVAGCTSLGRGGLSRASAADAADASSDSIFGEDVGTAGPSDETPPDQMEVAWQDNGQSIRPLTGPGKAQSMKVPSSKVKKSGTVSAAKD